MSAKHYADKLEKMPSRTVAERNERSAMEQHIAALGLTGLVQAELASRREAAAKARTDYERASSNWPADAATVCPECRGVGRHSERCGWSRAVAQ